MAHSGQIFEEARRHNAAHAGEADMGAARLFRSSAKRWMPGGMGWQEFIVGEGQGLPTRMLPPPTRVIDQTVPSIGLLSTP